MPRSGSVRAKRSRAASSGFNEAGAIMPRSGRKLKIAGNSLRYHGFNEAGAIMPRSGTN